VSAATRARPADGDGGFTLLEVLIALGLAVLLLGVTSGIVGRTAEARDELARRAHLVADARAALWILRDDLAGARPGTLRIERAHADGPPVISFERDSPTPRRLVYRLDGRRLVRIARDRFRVAGHGRRSVVTAGVRRLDVVALGEDGWQSEWSGTQAPRALTVTLDCAGAPRLTVAVLPLAGGAA
jgi:prepilin-type N-terminal cleavage/methylation domain-containing protein